MKKTLISLLIIVVLALIGWAVFRSAPEPSTTPDDTATTTPQDTGTSTPTEQSPTSVLGTSSNGNNITAYHYGDGDTELLFVGGIHGGYEWNTVLVSYELMDYLEANPNKIPDNVKVTVIPVLNPDGLEKIVGTTGRFTTADVPATLEATIPGRFNARDVDLNRNFDCDWKASGVWQNKTVSGGSAAFSEAESQAIRTYVEANNPDAVVVYYSSAGGVFASNCHEGVLPETREIVGVYATASGYPAYESFDYYTITGDMVNWLAKIGIPGISVLLTTHDDTEWAKNQKGVNALLSHYAQQ